MLKLFGGKPDHPLADPKEARRVIDALPAHRAIGDERSDVDADDAAALPVDRLFHDDRVLRVREAAVETEEQSGPDRITHLVIKYNAGTDLYDLRGHRINWRTGACPEVSATTGVYADGLKSTAEQMTGLYFTL